MRFKGFRSHFKLSAPGDGVLSHCLCGPYGKVTDSCDTSYKLTVVFSGERAKLIVRYNFVTELISALKVFPV